MSIAWVNGSSNAGNGGTAITVTMPSGYNAARNATYVNLTNQSNTATWTLPAGWTQIFQGQGSLIARRLYQAGDPSTVTFTLSVSGRWAYAAGCWSGVDDITPEDVINSAVVFAYSNWSNSYAEIIKYPSVNPTFNNDQLVLFGTDPTIAGSALTAPSGFTAREVVSANWAGVGIFDKALTGGANTGEQQQSGLSSSNANYRAGVTVALKAFGSTAVGTLAAPQVTLAGLYEYSNAGLVSVSPSLLNVAPGDLVAIFIGLDNTYSITPPAGYAAVETAAGGGLWTHTWQTGDSLAPTFTLGNTCAPMVQALVLHRVGTTKSPQVDASAVNTGTGSVSVAALTPTPGGNDYAWFWGWTPLDATATAAGLGPGTMTTDENTISESGTIALWQQGVTGALGPFTAHLNGGSGAQSGIAALFFIVPPPPGLAVSKANVYAVLAPAIPCPAPVLVQSQSMYGEGSVASVSLPAAATKGNFLTVQLSCNDFNAPGAFTDGAGGTWICPADMLAGTGGAAVRVGYMPNCAAGAHTAVSTEANMNGWSMTICEWSGMAPATAPDLSVAGEASFFDQAGGSVTVPQQTLAQVLELILGTFSIHDETGFADHGIGGPFSLLFVQDNSEPGTGPPPINGNAALHSWAANVGSETLPASTWSAANSGGIVYYTGLVTTFRIVCPTKGHFVQVCS